MMPFYLHPCASLIASSWRSAGFTALCILAGLLALALWLGCVWVGWLFWSRKQQVIFPLRITSRSNVFTQFQMRVDLGNLEKAIQTVWKQNDQVLPPAVLKQYSYVQEALPQPASPGEASLSKTGNKKPPINEKEKQKAKQGVQKVNLISNLVASISGMLAGILPGAMKTPFREVNSAIRDQQKKVAAAKAEVNHVQSTSRSLNQDVKRLGEATGVKNNGAAASGKPGGNGPAQTDSGRRLVVSETPVTETAVLEPGESGLFELILRPRNPLRSLEGDFRVKTQAVEIKEFSLYGSLPARTLSAHVKIQSENLQRALFAGLVVVSGALCAWGASELIGWLWLLRL